MNQNTNLIMKKFLCIVMMTIFAIPHITVAQEEGESSEPGLSIAGSVDTYYTVDFAGKDNITTSFADDRESISIGMVNVILSQDWDKVGFVGDLSFGPRSFKSIPAFQSDDFDQPTINVQNAYVYYSVSDLITVTAGYMGTFVGYEIISPTGNYNYSTSYLFTNGPFQNSGVKVDFSVSDNFGFMVGVFNDWNVYNDETNDKDIGAQVFYSPAEGMDIYLNTVFGGGSGTIFDLTAGFQLSDAFYLGVNAADYTFDDKDFGGYAGIALYPQLSLSDAFSLGLRGEYFNVKEITEPTLEAGSIGVFATTVSANYTVGGLTIIPEVRFDSASEDIFVDGDNLATGGAGQFTLAAVYAF